MNEDTLNYTPTLTRRQHVDLASHEAQSSHKNYHCLSSSHTLLLYQWVQIWGRSDDQALKQRWRCWLNIQMCIHMLEAFTAGGKHPEAFKLSYLQAFALMDHFQFSCQCFSFDSVFFKCHLSVIILLDCNRQCLHNIWRNVITCKGIIPHQKLFCQRFKTNSKVDHLMQRSC